MGDVGVGGDDRASRILSRQGFARVWHGEDLFVRYARGHDRGFLIVGAVVADRQGLDFNRQHADLLGRNP